MPFEVPVGNGGDFFYLSSRLWGWRFEFFCIFVLNLTLVLYGLSTPTAVCGVVTERELYCGL